jgi:hypothetical protein
MEPREMSDPWLLGGGTLAVLAVVMLALYGPGWFGGGAPVPPAPAAEQTR